MKLKRNFYTKTQKDLQKKNKGLKIASALLKKRVHTKLVPEYKKIIKNCNFLIISSYSNNYPDVSIKCGFKGFVKIVNDKKIEWNDYDGNRMYRTAGNISEKNKVSLLFIDFEKTNQK